MILLPHHLAVYNPTILITFLPTANGSSIRIQFWKPQAIALLGSRLIGLIDLFYYVITNIITRTNANIEYQQNIIFLWGFLIPSLCLDLSSLEFHKTHLELEPFLYFWKNALVCCRFQTSVDDIYGRSPMCWLYISTIKCEVVKFSCKKLICNHSVENNP